MSREEVLAWGRLKGALLRKYPEIRDWLNQKEKEFGGFAQFVEEMIYYVYLRERYGYKGFTLHDIMSALDVVREIIGKARDVYGELREFDREVGRSVDIQARREMAKSMATLMSGLTNMLGWVLTNIQMPRLQQPVQPTGAGKKQVEISDRDIDELIKS